MPKLRCPRGFQHNGSDSARLLGLLGPRRFSKLQDVFGGRKVWIPKAGTNPLCLGCRHRNECIKHWRQGGSSVESIARWTGLSSKTIYRILSH